MEFHNNRLVGKTVVALITFIMVTSTLVFVGAATGAIDTGTQTPELSVKWPVNNNYIGATSIKLATGGFDSSLGAPTIPTAWKMDAIPAGYMGQFLVQFDSPLTEADRGMLESLGATLEHYVPVNSWVVTMDPANRDQLGNSPRVSYIGIHQPFFKVTPGIASATGDQPIAAQLSIYAGASPNDVAAFFAKRGAEVVYMGEGQVDVLASPDLIRQAAFLPEVRGVVEDWDAQPLATTDLEAIGWTEQSKVNNQFPTWRAGQGTAIPSDAQFTTCDPSSSSGLLIGQGQVVGISDTGINSDHAHFRDSSNTWPEGDSRDTIDPTDLWEDRSGPDPSPPVTDHRKFVRIMEWGDNIVDLATEGHGTHVTSLVAGNGAPEGQNTAWNQGSAPCAKISFHDIGRSGDGSGNNDDTLGGIPSDLKDYHQRVYDDNGHIDTNSWGVPVCNDDPIPPVPTDSEGLYSSDSRNSDLFMWDNKDFLVFFSAGNDRVPGCAGMDYQYGEGTVTPPATLKNGMAIASHRSQGNWDDTSSFSSWGPTADGRLKPDISCSGDGTTDFGGIRAAATDLNRDGVRDTTSQNLQGTSMSGPVCAGYGAITTQYYVDGFYPPVATSPFTANGFQPSGALVKATMINGARDPGAAGILSNVNDYSRIGDADAWDFPNNDVGWGMNHMDDALFFNSEIDTGLEMRVIDYQNGLLDGDSFLMDVSINSGTQFKVTLVWHDFPGEETTHGALVNDLDLTVTRGGTTYIGNNFGATNRESQSGIIAYDSQNNVEQVSLLSPTAGSYTIRVDAALIAVGPQPFSLVVSGSLDQNLATMTLDRTVYGHNSTVIVTVEDFNGPAGSLTVDATSTAGDTLNGIVLTETAPGSKVYRGTFKTMGALVDTGNGDLEVRDGDTFTVTYATDGISQDANIQIRYPVVTNVFVSDIGNKAAIVHWNTDIPSNATVIYGIQGSPVDTYIWGGTDQNINHEVTLLDLIPFTTYEFQVRSDTSYNTFSLDTNGGNNYAFTTQDNPDVLIVVEDDNFALSALEVKDWTLSTQYHGWSAIVWETVKFGLPTLTDLQAAKVVVWDVGEGYPQLGGTERLLLQSFMGSGGLFWAVGQDIGWDMDAPAGGTDPDTAWYQTWLHARFLQDDADGGAGTEGGGTGTDPFRVCKTAQTITNPLTWSMLPNPPGCTDLEEDVYNPGGGRFWPDDIMNDQGGVAPPPIDYNAHVAGGDAAGIAFTGAYTLVYWAFAHTQIQVDGTYGLGGFVFGTDVNIERADLADRVIQYLLGGDHPDVLLTAPTGGQTLVGTTSITWTPTGAFTQKIQLSNDGGQSWTDIFSGLAGGTSSQSWDTTAYPNGNTYRVRVEATSATGLRGSDMSGSNFTIDNGVSGDTRAPIVVTGSISSFPIPVDVAGNRWLNATISDALFGNSNLASAEYYWPFFQTEAQALQMDAADGTFDSSVEDVTVGPLFDLKAIGTWDIAVRGCDVPGNCGNWVTYPLIVIGLDTTPPISDAGVDVFGDSWDGASGLQVTFDSSASSDDYAVTNFWWNFTYDGSLTTLTGPAPTFEFRSPGVYTVTLEVEDSAGNADATPDSMVVMVNQSIEVITGWNLIGLNGDHASAGPDALFDDSGGSTVWTRMFYFDNSAQQWLSYDKSRPAYMNLALSGLAMDETTPIWINIQAGHDGFLNFDAPANPAVGTTMVSGWNLVSYAKSMGTGQTVNTLPGGCSLIYEADLAAPTNQYRMREMVGTDVLMPDNAYWFFCTGGEVWT